MSLGPEAPMPMKEEQEGNRTVKVNNQWATTVFHQMGIRLNMKHVKHLPAWTTHETQGWVCLDPEASIPMKGEVDLGLYG